MTDGIHTKNDKDEQLGEDKFIEFLEYANYLNHHKKSDYKRTFGNVERAIYSFNGR